MTAIETIPKALLDKTFPEIIDYLIEAGFSRKTDGRTQNRWQIKEIPFGTNEFSCSRSQFYNLKRGVGSKFYLDIVINFFLKGAEGTDYFSEWQEFITRKWENFQIEDNSSQMTGTGQHFDPSGNWLYIQMKADKKPFSEARNADLIVGEFCWSKCRITSAENYGCDVSEDKICGAEFHREWSAEECGVGSSTIFIMYADRVEPAPTFDFVSGVIAASLVRGTGVLGGEVVLGTFYDRGVRETIDHGIFLAERIDPSLSIIGSQKLDINYANGLLQELFSRMA